MVEASCSTRSDKGDEIPSHMQPVVVLETLDLSR